MNNKTALSAALTLGLTSSITLAVEEPKGSDLVVELDKGKVVQKIIPLEENVEKNVYIYKRKRHLTSSRRDRSYPDYFYLWHGEKMSAYPFMNLTTLMSNNATLNKPKAIFLALDNSDGLWSEGNLDSALISAVADNYKKETNLKREISVGYDTGVAQSYSFACGRRIPYIVMAAGGLSKSESCKVKDTQVLYTYNATDKQYPYDHETAFSSSKSGWSTLKNRLDAKQTIEKLKNLMQCENYVSTEALRSKVHSFSCSKGNLLTVVETSTSLHQWNGYSNVSQGSYNQEGSSIKPPVTYWINSEFGIK